MFKTKKDVDKHVRVSLSKLRSESEKYLRGFTIAKLYYNISEYETAEQYLINFLSVKGDSAPAFKLLGDCYHSLKDSERALQMYQRSLEIDSKQPDLIKHVCKILLSNGNMSSKSVKYWRDWAESLEVQGDSALALKLKMWSKNNTATQQIEELITKQIVINPDDSKFRVQLIRYYLDKNKISQAVDYAYAVEMEHHNVVADSLDWYNSMWLALTEYKNSSNCKKDWKYWLLLITCIESCVFLTLCNEQNEGETQKIEDCLNLLFDFGKYLLKASEVVLTLCPIRECAMEFLNHFKGQFCLHAATMLFIKEQNGKKNQWRETTSYAVPLLLFAYHCGTPDYTEFWLKRADGQTRQLIKLWERQGAFRCVQAGRTLLSCVKDSRDSSYQGAWSSTDELLSHAIKLCASDSWRTDLFHMLFTNVDHINNMKASYLVSCPQLSDPKFEAPVVADIEHYEETAQYCRPQSLQVMVYLCLGCSDYSEIRCKFFDGLRFSSQTLLITGPECLTQLDVDSFLYASAIQAKRKMNVAHSYYEDYSSRIGWKPQILPYPNLYSNLCSDEQSSWWIALYTVYNNLRVENKLEMRTTIIYGLQAVRCQDGPKMDLPIVFKLGQIFVNRAQDASKASERMSLDARAERFYKFGINMLKLHQKNELEPFRKLFKYPSSLQNAMDTKELNTLAEEAITYLSARYLEKGEYEECLEQLTGIQLPSATYFQAEAYVKMDESIETSKKKKKHYTDKAKDYFNQTLDLLTNSESQHPLNSLVQAQMKRLQQNRLSVDSFTNGYEHDDYVENTFMTKTPSRVRREILTSSPKFSELENLVRQMNLNLKEELTQVIKMEVSNMRRDFLEFKEKLNSIEDNIKKKSEPPSSDEAANVLEDLCRMDDDLQTQTYSAQQPLYLNFNQQQQRIHTPNALPPAAVNAYNSPLYNTNYPINYYSQYMMPVGTPAVTLQTAARNSLGINSHVPFVDPNMNFNLQAQAPPQLPTIADTRPNLIGVLGQQQTPQPPIEKPSINPQGNSLSTMWNKFYNNQPVEKGPPINVVITSSDPLPSHTSISQQSNLSVTIPIQHIKSSTTGNNIITQPPVQPSLQNQSGSINNFSVIQHNSPFADLNNFPSMKSTATFEGSVSSASTNTTNLDASKTSSKPGGFFIKTIQDNKKALDSENEVSSDFKPINATPVSDNKAKPVKDKNEEVVFSSQIKIFKLQKDWKEQGVGFLKILRNKTDSTKRRLVLKDNGQKIYADIVITADISPTPYGNDEKCYIINIPGTTDPQQESFRIKFKNAEAAKQFYKSFEDSQKEVKSTTPGKPDEPQKQVTASPAPAPFSFNFGKTVSAPKQDEPTPFSSLFSKKDTATSSTTSFVPTTTPASSPFSGLFLTKTTPADLSKTSTIFGVPQTETPKDLSNKTTSLNVSNEHVEEDEYVPTAQFKPVIPLPDLVEVQTGEENEEILFEHRAKLLRFDSGEWKERGVGNIKLLVDKDDVNRVRLIMRREQVLKLCCNQRVTKDLKFNKFPNNNAVLSWAGQDYSENELRTELFSIRFKTADICKSFHDAILKAQDNMTEGSAENVEHEPTNKTEPKEEELVKGFGDKFKPAPGSWTCSACYLSNKADAQACAACNQSKNKDENKDDNSKSDVVKIPATNPSGSSLNSGGFQGFGDKFKMKPGSWTCKACYINNESNVLYCVACETPKDDTVPKKESKNIFDAASTKSAGFTFGFSTPESSKPTPAGSFAFGKPMGFSFGNTAPVSKPASGSKNLFATTSTTSETTTPATAESKSFGFSLTNPTTPSTMFGVSTEESQTSSTATSTTVSTTLSKPAFSFTMPESTPKEKSDAFNLEKQEFNFVLKPKSPGKTKSPMKNTSGVEEESDSENVEEENNTYFTPVIPLPDKVEVKTGEENEEVLYCHRAKLFRFAEGEWKERGLGDVKILRHSETKKLRVVMRREQVLKICLNHVLNEEVDYKKKDDKSWHFVVNDFSEGEIELMQFCLRFKTSEIAQSFLQATKDAIAGKGESLAEAEKDIIKDSESKIVTDITENEKKMADKLKLPYSFYDCTESKCTGCRGCDPDDFVFPEHATSQNTEDNRPPLPLEMPKLPKAVNHSLIKNSSLSFASVTPQQNENATETKSIFGTSNLFGIKSDPPTTPLAPKTDAGGENKFALNLSQKAEGTQDQSKPMSGGFIFGNATSFGNADKAKSTFGQGSVFGGFGSTFGSNSTSQTSIFGGSTQSKLFSTGEEKTTFPFNAASSAENKENLFTASKPAFSFTTSSMFSNSSEPIFGGAINANATDPAKKEPQNLFANLASSFNSKKEPEQKSEASSSEVLFKNDPGLSFASLAKDAGKAPTFHTTSNTKEFVGLTGDDAFRNFLSPKEDGNAKHDGAGNDSTADDSNHDPHYDPIIELPEEIVVTTGEEEEEKLFGERAFLYRYDSVNKEWKERGVGELKLLHHPVQGTYRLVMRREQIHKLVLNHAITDSFHLNQMNNSGKSFCWAAMNYAEDNGQLEKLAARFKNTDLAGKFEAEINKCVNQLKNRADLEPEED